MRDELPLGASWTVSRHCYFLCHRGDMKITLIRFAVNGRLLVQWIAPDGRDKRSATWWQRNQRIDRLVGDEGRKKVAQGCVVKSVRCPG